jgi:hypothetical protein
VHTPPNHHSLGISERAKHVLNANSAERGKEIPQVHAPHNSFSDMRSHEGSDRASSDEAMRRRMRRNFPEDPEQNLSLQIFQTRFRHFNQAHAVEALGQHSIVIVLEPRLPLFVAQSFQISKPSQLAWIQPQPLCQVSNRFNRRNFPDSAAAAGEHLLWRQQPFRNHEFIGVLPAHASKPGILPEELHHLAMARPCLGSEFCEISLSERPKPAPASAERAAATIEEEIGRRFAGQQSPSQRLNQGRIGHDRRRRNAPTSLTLREQPCVGAHQGSCDE